MAALNGIQKTEKYPPRGLINERRPSDIARRRKIAIRTGVAAVVAALSAGVYVGHEANGANERNKTLSYVVKPGDTIWKIADRISDNKDLREEVFNIEQHVELDSAHPNASVVQPGDQLLYQQGGKVLNFVERDNK